MQTFLKIFEMCVPIVVAFVGLIPTIISSGNKTQKKIDSYQKDMKLSIDEIQKKLDAHIKDDEEAQAKQRRVRILRFNDEICAGGIMAQKSENSYEDIIEDIDAYEWYCATHPNYKNNKGRLAMEHIKAEYEKHKTNHDFLV